MAKQVVLWEAEKAGGTHKSEVEADLADARDAVFKLVSDDVYNQGSHYHTVMDPLLVTEFLLANWTELVELVPKCINLQEKARLESENARKNHNEKRFSD